MNDPGGAHVGAVVVELEQWRKIEAALVSADSILSLLHYRGLVDSDWNREDVKSTMEKVIRFSRDFDRHATSLSDYADQFSSSED